MDSINRDARELQTAEGATSSSDSVRRETDVAAGRFLPCHLRRLPYRSQLRIAAERPFEAELALSNSGERFEFVFQFGAWRDVKQFQPSMQNRAREMAEPLAEAEIDY